MSKCYVDNVFEEVKRHAVGSLTEHLNQVDATCSIQFASKSKKDKSLPFLDMLIVRKPDGHVKLMVLKLLILTNICLSHHITSFNIS